MFHGEGAKGKPKGTVLSKIRNCTFQFIRDVKKEEKASRAG